MPFERWRQGNGKTKARPPYGFIFFQGAAIKDPVEYPTLQLISNLWKQEQFSVKKEVNIQMPIRRLLLARVSGLNPGGNETCRVQRFRADEVESVVLNHLREMLSRAGAFSEIEENLNKVGAQNTNDIKSEIQTVEKEIQKIDLDIESTFQVLSKMSNSEGAVNLAGKRLENLNSELEKKMNRKRDLEDGLPDSVDPTATRDFIHTRWEEFKRGWAKGTSAQKKRLLRRLIYKLVPADGGFKVYYVTGEQDFVQGTANVSSEPKLSVMSEIEPNSQFHAKGRQRNSAYATDSGLVIVTNGAGDGFVSGSCPRPLRG